MKKHGQSALFLLALVAGLLMGEAGCEKYPSSSLRIKVGQDKETRQLCITVKNQSKQEVVFNDHNFILRNMDWRLCSNQVVLLQSGYDRPDYDPRFPIHYWGYSLRANDEHTFYLYYCYPKLENATTNQSANRFLWHWCFWDAATSQWIQEKGQIDLK